MQLFFAQDIESDYCTLNEDESHHCVKVMRLTVGDPVSVTDGSGTLCHCTILEAHPKHCLLQVYEHITDYGRHAFHLHVAVAPTKNTARMEWFVEKAVEMGIDEITPIICDHSERCLMRQDRLQKIAVSAMKQSLKAFMPLIHPPTTLHELIERVQTQQYKNNNQDNNSQFSILNSQLFIAYCDGDHRTPLHDIYHPGENVLILIGPEGDFSPKEIEQALSAGFHPVTLGQYRLRTETAALAATAFFNLVN